MLWLPLSPASHAASCTPEATTRHGALGGYTKVQRVGLSDAERVSSTRRLLIASRMIACWCCAHCYVLCIGWHQVVLAPTRGRMRAEISVPRTAVRWHLGWCSNIAFHMSRADGAEIPSRAQPASGDGEPTIVEPGVDRVAVVPGCCTALGYSTGNIGCDGPSKTTS
jgi:hypothetical protein